MLLRPKDPGFLQLAGEQRILSEDTDDRQGRADATRAVNANIVEAIDSPAGMGIFECLAEMWLAP